MQRTARFGITSVLVLASLAGCANVGPPSESSRFEQLADADFVENRPTEPTAEMLREELLFQRATQTYLWALPLMNTLGMKVGSEKTFGAGYNVLPVWKERLDAKTLVTTPNSDVGEGANLAGPDWRGMLAAIGIVQGKPFEPDAHTREILEQAARTGYKMSRVVGFEEVVSGRSFRIYPDRRWLNPTADATPEDPGGPLDLAWHRKVGNYLDLDTRIWFFTDYYSISPGMISQVPGKGAKYMIAFTDGVGAPLVGGSNYALHLPPDIPAANFWSLTLYEAENASGLANGQPFPSLGSRDHPAQNADGSTDLYLGPASPEGKRANWLATVPGRGYFAILRLYAPTEKALDKSWKPGDIEKPD